MLQVVHVEQLPTDYSNLLLSLRRSGDKDKDEARPLGDFDSLNLVI